MEALANRSLVKKTCAVIIAACGWFSLIFQLCLTEGTVANFISYFTIETNLLVALCLTCTALIPRSKAGQFFSKLSVQSAIALYIFIVGLVYNLVLRGIWSPEGWQLLVDNMLHVVMPVLYLLYWLFFRPSGTLHWRDGLYWMLFPLLYLIYSLIRGAWVHWYPYPFLNAEEHGYGKVFINVILMVLTFFIAGLALIWITRSLKKEKQANG